MQDKFTWLASPVLILTVSLTAGCNTFFDIDGNRPEGGDILGDTSVGTDTNTPDTGQPDTAPTDCNGVTCTAGQGCCGTAGSETCIDIFSDLNNCGACGNICNEGESCVGGNCTCGDTVASDGVACDGGICCSDECVTDSTDPLCICPGEGAPCQSGERCCNDACLSITDDASNCGGCGTTCVDVQICENSVCTCPNGTELCGDTCVDLQTSDVHCGACDKTCVPQNATGTACVAGVCEPECQSGFDTCDTTPELGCTIDLSGDAENCSACGNACDTTTTDSATCENSVCSCSCSTGFADCNPADATTNPANADCCETNTTDSAENCGACGNACGSGGGCFSSICKCGASGDICPDSGTGYSSATCSSGNCILQCDTDREDCDGNSANGCEIDTSSDPGHCGGCAQACGTGGVCDNGLCDQFKEVALGGQFTCALREGGALTCCGSNQYGQIGDNTVTNRGGPTLSIFQNTTALRTRTATGSDHTCTIEDTGKLFCWGRNDQGQIGAGNTTANFRVPQEVSALPRAPFFITAGFSHTCAITLDSNGVNNEVWCWGDNSDGQVGDGNTTDTVLSPVQATITDASFVAAGQRHTCAIKLDGTVWCWGSNDAGQCGNPGSTRYTSPVQVFTDAAETQALTGATELALGRSHSCALTSANEVWCWGSNQFGQLGNGSATGSGQEFEFADQVNSSSAFRQISSFDFHTCAVDTSDLVECWGRGFDYALGDGTDTGSGNTDAPTPVSVVGLSSVDYVEAGGQHSCARLKTTGRIHCWGSNSTGALCTGSVGGTEKTATQTNLSP